VDAKSTTPQRLTKWHWLSLAGILCVATFTRFWHIGSNEAHFDELWLMEFSTGRESLHEHLPESHLTIMPSATSLSGALPWWTLWTRASTDTKPPLYRILLRWWRDLFGESVAVARSLSALFSVLTVAAMFWLVLETSGACWGLYAALITAVASMQVEQAQAARQYALATCAAVSWAALLLTQVRLASLSGKRSWLAPLVLGAATFLTLLTHYLTAPLMLVLAIYAAFRMSIDARRRILAPIVAGALLFAVLWGPHILEQRAAIALTSRDLLDTQPHHLIVTSRRVAILPLRMLFEPRGPTVLLAIGGVTMYVLPWIIARRRAELRLWALWLWFTAGYLAFSDIIQTAMHLELTRHAYLVAPAVYAILATMFAGARRILAHGFPVMIAVACAAALPAGYARPDLSFTAVSNSLARAGDSDHPVVFCTSADQRWWAGLLYLGCSHYSGTFPRPAACVAGSVDSNLMDELRKTPQFIVVAANSSAPVEQLFPDAQATFAGGDPYVASVYQVRWKR
jgi:uncharacterized membrane protein